MQRCFNRLYILSLPSVCLTEFVQKFSMMQDARSHSRKESKKIVRMAEA